MNHQGHGQHHAGSDTDVGALPPTQPMTANGNASALEHNPLQTANPDAFPAMPDGQLFIQDANLGNVAMPSDSPSVLVPMVMAMASGESIQIPPPNTVSP
ncbi:hypothetical protein E4U42_000226, partial [Claviceps africana]